MKHIALVLLLLWSNQTLAWTDPRPHKNNGCSVPSALMVVATTFIDAFSLFNGPVDIEPVCQHHDVCYATLGSTQQQCDTDFKQQARNQCRETYAVERRAWSTLGGVYISRALCFGAVSVMHSAIKAHGDSHFYAAQNHTRKLLSSYPSRAGNQRLLVSFVDQHPYMTESYAVSVYRELDKKLRRQPTNLELWQSLADRFSKTVDSIG
jgi:hypothetical protein